MTEEIICWVFTLHLTSPHWTLKYEHDTVLDILLGRMLAEILSRLVPRVAVMTKSRPGVPPVCWRVFALLFSSLSLSPDSHSVRPSVSQSAGQVWFGYRVQKKTKQIFPAEYSFASSCMLGSLYFSFLCCSVIFFIFVQFYKIFFLYQFSGLWTTQVQAGERRGEEREGDCVAFKSIWQTLGPSFHHLLIRVKIFQRPDYWGIRM